jgi:hypothetical protein
MAYCNCGRYFLRPAVRRRCGGTFALTRTAARWVPRPVLPSQARRKLYRRPPFYLRVVSNSYIDYNG